MDRAKVLHVYLDDGKRAQIAAGAAGIHTRIVGAAKAAGWQVELHPVAAAPPSEGYHLVYNRTVDRPFCLSLRRCHMDPFFRIETTNDRWDWQVASLKFDAQNTPKRAAGFQTRWRQRLFHGLDITQDGFIFMPLQGKPDTRRHFQSMSPFKMIDATLLAEPHRKIVATLHPRESYSDHDLAKLRRFGPRFELRPGPSMALLAGCDLVVTQNSGMALTGFFADKPAVLFARIDFHHIAASVPHIGVAAAFSTANAGPPPFAGYLDWFFRRQAINATAADAENQIRMRFQNLGWPM